ncbi:unnamed protein product [Closterium sp. Naga37s-1]|nr:unnamed protein product [Closterium sp. Naga37s-1]
MEAYFWVVFAVLVVLCLALEFSRSSKDRAQTTPAFESFKNNYLLVYCLMMGTFELSQKSPRGAGGAVPGARVLSRLQGPRPDHPRLRIIQEPPARVLPHDGYVTDNESACIAHYDKGDIGRLFIAGFGSSMVFGTIVGSLADRHGRRLACVLYCVTYILSCLTKHFPAFSILVLGRVLGGIATSLLFSAFESWLVAEHFARGFEPPWLSITFSKAIFLGNGLVAILSGLVANVLVTDLNLGPVAPFDAASVLLAGGMAVIVGTWSENHGDSDQSHGLLLQFQLAYHAIASDEKIAILGAIQSLFEASMYTFVFLWTPALAPSQQAIPHGFIFSLFMLASMLGSSLASRLMGRAGLKVEVYMQAVFAVSSLSLLLPCIVNWVLERHPPPGGGITAGGRVQLAGFCVFEACVGVFWPSLMRMRAQYLPEESRSTIMNFFRVPLNVFVCLVLYHVRAFPMTSMFLMCSLFLAIAALLQRRLLRLALSALPQSECTPFTHPHMLSCHSTPPAAITGKLNHPRPATTPHVSINHHCALEKFLETSKNSCPHESITTAPCTTPPSPPTPPSTTPPSTTPPPATPPPTTPCTTTSSPKTSHQTTPPHTAPSSATPPPTATPSASPPFTPPFPLALVSCRSPCRPPCPLLHSCTHLSCSSCL